MKKIITITFLFFMQQVLFAQKTKLNSARIKVEITNTDGRAVFLGEDFFTLENSKQILKQINTAKFAQVKQYADQKNYPKCIEEVLKYNPSEPENNYADTVLKALKLYQIASFVNIRGGVNCGKMVILEAPSTENNPLFTECRYTNSFYIIMKATSVKSLK